MRFTIRLPMIGEPRRSGRPCREPGPRVLVIDDEIQIRRFLRISLEANHYEVYEVGNGLEGISRAAQLRPDLIILDMGLPDIDGLEALRRLREDNNADDYPFRARRR